MADTMKFGPEWLRALSDGSQSSGASGVPSSKFKLAEYRYGREEMLTLYQNPYEPPPVLKKFPHIFMEETQTPIALMPLSEDEQRLIAQGVNSQVVMRPGRGGQTATRGGRGGLMMDRGRARGRGRGEVYSRGSLENGDIGGGFGRPRGPNKDGWEEVGNRKLERGFSRPFDDMGREGHPRFSRSMSDNWRDKGPADDEDEGDWRKPANRERWSTRTNWREPGRGGHDLERREGATFHRNRGGFETEDRGRRMGEPRDSEDVPEWIDDGTEDVGSFDASGAFVSNREQPFSRDKKEDREDPLQGSADLPPTDHHDKQAGGPQHQREQDGWESSDSSQDIHQPASNDTGGQGQGSRDDPGPAVATTKEEGEESSGVSVVTGTLSSLAPDVLMDVVSNVTVVEEEAPKINAPVIPITHENGLKWYYVDPQENLQGPFASEDMAQWFSAGYFTMCLKVKRGCDHHFQPLGDLMKQWGHVPFVPGPVHPPIVKSQQTAANPQETMASSTASPITATSTLPPTASLPQPPAPAPVPTAATPAPVTPMSSLPLGQGSGGTESLLVQQQLLIQHQILQLEVEIRQLQMQTLSQLQEQEGFQALDAEQQHQVSLQLMQASPLLHQRLQQLQQLQHMQQQTQHTHHQLQLLSSQGAGLAAPPLASATASAGVAASSASTAAVTTLPSQLVPSVTEITRSSSSPTFSLPVSQPPTTGEGQGQGDITSIWGSVPPAGGWPSAQPTSVWELENSMPPPVVKTDLEKMRKEKEEFVRMMEAERKQQEEIQKQQEELRRQAEALQRERGGGRESVLYRVI